MASNDRYGAYGWYPDGLLEHAFCYYYYDEERLEDGVLRVFGGFVLSFFTVRCEGRVVVAWL